MNADRVEVSWDAEKNSWLVRIEVGAEVIRRHCKEPKSADDQTLQTARKRLPGMKAIRFPRQHLRPPVSSAIAPRRRHRA